MNDLKSSFSPISAEEEAIGKAVVNAAYTVHKALSPGLLEKVYEDRTLCFLES